MGNSENIRKSRSHFVAFVLAAVFVILGSYHCLAQTTAQTKKKPKSEFPIDLEKNPGLLTAFGELFEKLQRSIQFPPMRTQSQLLPLLPESTNFYLAIPNYGEVTHQALDVFRQKLNEDPALRSWWTQGELATKGPKIEDSLDKFYQLSQFLGDEIVVSGEFEEKDPKLLVMAEIRKPGFREALQKAFEQKDRTAKPFVRILTPAELASVDITRPSQGFLVLVRPDLFVAATDPGMLLRFNARLEQATPQLASSSLGQRIQQAYAEGVSTVGAADLQNLISQVAAAKPANQQIVELLGFDNLKYLVWNHTKVDGRALSQAELSFNGPRHGIPAWLGAPSTLGSLEFVSPKALMAASVVLNDPGQIFEDVKGFAVASNPKSLISLEQMEQSLGISLKDDLFGQLAGEITFELDSFEPPEPAWKAVVKVRNSQRFQQTLNTLLTAAHLRAERFESGGVAYQVIRIPSPKKETVIGLAFVENYLIIASSPTALEEAVRLQRTGESLGKSERFLAALPPGHSGMSAMWYQDPTAMAALQFQRFSPELAASLSQSRGQANPIIACLYGEETAIRHASTNQGFDVGTTLVVAAVAIPNLLRARVAANEAAAVGSVRTINVAQVTYATTYPARGFARDLASLGPDPRGTNAASARHAGYLDSSLANPACAGAGWCEKSGYRFTVSGVCKKTCTEFVVVATPVSASTGKRSFCSTSDGVIRMSSGFPLKTPVSASECRRWPALQ